MFYRFQEGPLHFDVLFPQKQGKINILKLAGLPGFPREDKFTRFCQDNGCQIFFPHYLGSWLSKGVFTPDNCLQTVDLALTFIQRGRAKELYFLKEKTWPAKTPIVLGSSFGGWTALKVCSLHPGIKKCALFAPLVDIEQQGKWPGEEDLDHTLQFLRRAFGPAFRGLERQTWDKFFQGKGEIAPINLDNIRQRNFFIVHGRADPTINYHHSRALAAKLKELGNRVVYHEIGNANHRIRDFFSGKLLEEFLAWTRS